MYEEKTELNCQTNNNMWKNKMKNVLVRFWHGAIFNQSWRNFEKMSFFVWLLYLIFWDFDQKKFLISFFTYQEYYSVLYRLLSKLFSLALLY